MEISLLWETFVRRLHILLITGPALKPTVVHGRDVSFPWLLSLLIMATTWKCCTICWHLLLWGVFSVYAGLDTPRPHHVWWVLCETPKSNHIHWAIGEVGTRGWTYIVYKCCGHEVAPSKYEKVLKFFRWATRCGACWVCTSTLLCRVAVVLWVCCLLSPSPWRHYLKQDRPGAHCPIKVWASWQYHLLCQELVAQVTEFSGLGILAQASCLPPTTDWYQICLWYRRQGIFSWHISLWSLSLAADGIKE